MIKDILDTVFNKANEWHENDMTVFEFNSPYPALKLLYHNYQTWHLIDLYKTNPEQIQYDSHGILHNKLRNNAIAELDEIFNLFQKETGKYHSETLGDIIDKIIISYIKVLHLPNGENKDCVKKHIEILTTCAEDLFKEMNAGTRKCPVIKRFKV